jgi:hypothetical protein
VRRPSDVKNKKRFMKDGLERTYTKAPPALPSLVTLPLPKELLMSVMAASRAFCCNPTETA